MSNIYQIKLLSPSIFMDQSAEEIILLAVNDLRLYLLEVNRVAEM